ncbi:hypothetical protein BGW38_010715 [Lunasporangiospora selenospora]|uniref:HECT-type E3 ubiquitin transferase n=1 Tax=Lunasporangiospora selenospora TaxID=979761 RepID=A0A9P6FWC8_9FUNG|nr:hypothetical protein BGW38_010715 [Lunasporangiospora selenospora]
MEPVSVGPLFAPYSRMLPTANSIHRNHGHPSSLSCFDLGKHSDPDNSSTEHSTEHSTSGSASWPGCVDGENTRSFSKTRHRPSDILTGANSISNQPNNSDSLDIDIRSNGIQDHAQKTPCCQSPIAADIPTLSLTDLKFAVSIYNLSENNEESAVHSIELERDGLTGLYWNSEKYQDFDTTDQKDSQSRKQTLARHMSAPCITDTMSAIDRESSSRSDTQANSNSRVDHHSLFTTLRQTFSSAEVLGSSFLVGPNSEQEPSEDSKLILPTTNVGGIDLDALRECYEVLIEIKPRTVFTIQVTNYMETLLAQLEQELSIRSMPWQEQHMRAILFLLMWLSCLDEEGMAQLVTLLKLYLSAHFTPRPTGNHHPAVCAVNALSILYQANINDKSIKQRNSVPSSQEDNHHFDTIANSVISFRYFYSGVMEALNFKDEYQIWRSGWDKSPEDRFFSYFDYPFLLSPTAKSHVISLDALLQMSAHYEDACIRHALADHAQRLLPEDMSSSAHVFQMSIRAGSSPYLVLELGRERLVEEAFEQITKKHADLKKPLKVAFVDVGEEGMDQGGVTKEFFQLMVEKVFDSRFGLFTELDDGSHSWWFQGEFDGSSIMKESGPDSKTRLIEYELVGILVGLALYNGVILGVRFPSVVYRKLLGWDIGLGSFQESFPALGHGLDQMLQWNDGDVYDVFMRSFEISYEHLGHVSTIPLIPGGQDIPVTNENREEYVKAYIDHYVNQHISQEFEAFHRGFEKICGGKALKLLRPEELELLLCGNSDLDMHELEVNCLYDDGFSSAHPLIKSFWEIVHQELTAKQHKELLVFVTGSDRVPIRGLKDLLFVIQRNGPDSDRLPTALTCFSRLLLPEYSHRDKMKERLVTAIENSNGFGLYLGQRAAQAIDVELMSTTGGGFAFEQLVELGKFCVAQAITKEFKKEEYPRVVVFAGPGNNGLDGLVAARHLTHFGYRPKVYYPKRPNKPLSNGLVVQCNNLGISFVDSLEVGLQESDLVVDAIFGNLDGEGFQPNMLVSLTAPKQGAAGYTGLHYLGGRFITEKEIDEFVNILEENAIRLMAINIPQWVPGTFREESFRTEIETAVVAPRCYIVIDRKSHLAAGAFTLSYSDPFDQQLWSDRVQDWKDAISFHRLVFKEEYRGKELTAVIIGFAEQKTNLDELDEFIEILERAAEWMESMQLKQWIPGTFRQPEIRGHIGDAIRSKSCYVVYHQLSSTIAAIFTLNYSDPFDHMLWSHYSADWLDAVYLHRLVVEKAFQGRGIVPKVIQFTEEAVKTAGKHFLRLDCRANNPPLRKFYSDKCGLRPEGEYLNPETGIAYARFERLVVSN